MKPFHQLSITGRAGLLHRLFPEHIPPFIDFTMGVCESIVADPLRDVRSWDASVMSYGRWYKAVRHVQLLIKRFGGSIEQSHYVFAEQLFEGDSTHFMVQCLQNYVSIRKEPDVKFMQAVTLFFIP